MSDKDVLAEIRKLLDKADTDRTRRFREELERMHKPGDIMQPAMTECVMDLMRIVDLQGHSGFSHSYMLNLFRDLSRNGIVTPLTGEEEEWGEPYCDDGTRQNKRCSHVFMDGSGRAYDIDGIVWEDEESELRYTNKHSFVPVEFPYYPKTVVKPSSEDPGRQVD